METTKRVTFVVTVVGLLSLYSGSPARAQEAPADEERSDRVWANAAELSWVVATGNAEVNTLGFRNVYEYDWDGTTLSWEAGLVRAASRDGDRVALIDEGGFEIVDPPTQIDSQRLYSKLTFRQDLAAQHYWFLNYDSVRDEPSNITRQFVGAAGFGTRWVDREELRFRTQYGFSATNEDLTLEGTNSFGGYRLSYTLEGVVSGARVDSELTLDASFQEADDIRTDWLNGVNVAINSRLALRSSIRVLFRNLPALEEVNLVTPGGSVVRVIEILKRRIDTNVTTSLVITF